MGDKEKLSTTMRIDLIPETPTSPTASKKKKVVIARSARKSSSSADKKEHVKTSDIEEKVANSEYQELLQSVYDAALISDLSGRIIDVNVRAMEFLQYDRMELESLTIFDIISGSDESLIETLWENLGNERFTLIQAYCVRRDGSFFPAEVAVNKLTLGEVHLCFFIRDITLRRQAEEMLRTEHNAIQNSGNGIVVADLNTEIEYANPATANLWAYRNTDELLGKDIKLLFGDQDAVKEMIEIVMSEGKSWTGEMPAVSDNGDTFDIQISAACNRNADGETVGMVFSFVDIGDKKRAEEAEREAERNRVMLESLGAACHHLGQPATVLLANLGIINHRIELEDDLAKELVGSCITAAETLGDILHKLNEVNEYKTTEYLSRPEGSDASDSRILDIQHDSAS